MLIESQKENIKILRNNFFDISQNISSPVIYKVIVVNDVVFIFVMWGAVLDQPI